MARKWQLFLFVVITCGALCFASSSSNKPQAQGSNRQSGAAAALTGSGILSTLGSMVPGVVSNMLPLVLLFGLGALMVPALGLGLLLREGRRSDPYYYRSFPSFNINTAAIMDGVSDVFERVMKALDNVDKKYN